MRTHGSPSTTLWMFLVLVAPCFSVAPAAARATATATSFAPAVARPSPPLAAWYDNLWDKIWTKIYGSLNNRTGVIQWGLIGMLLALWIIWWRK
jgi:hypothetical protein